MVRFPGECLLHPGRHVGKPQLLELRRVEGTHGKIAIPAGSLTATNHSARVQGFRAAIATSPGLEIVVEEPDDDNLEQAYNLARRVLAEHPDLAGIFGATATGPVGAARAVSNAGRAGEVVIVGMDDLQRHLNSSRTT